MPQRWVNDRRAQNGFDRCDNSETSGRSETEEAQVMADNRKNGLMAVLSALIAI